MPAHPERPAAPSLRQQRFASWVTDVLVYIVVLNLFVEHVDAIVIDSFTISVFTAVVLKALLDAILGLEHRVSEWFSERPGTMNRVLGFLAVWAILFGSKFLILEVIDIVFGDHVELGHFIDVLLLVIAMIAAREAMWAAFNRLADPEED